MTVEQAYATQKSIWRHLVKVDGYQPFGYDWRTLRLTRPQIADVLWKCYSVIRGD